MLRTRETDLLIEISQFQVKYLHKASSSLVPNNHSFRSRQWNHLLAEGKTQGSTLQQRTKKTLTIGRFDNTCEANEVSPEVEVGVVAGLRCLQPYMGHKYVIVTLNITLRSYIYQYSVLSYNVVKP